MSIPKSLLFLLILHFRLPTMATPPEIKIAKSADGKLWEITTGQLGVAIPDQGTFVIDSKYLAPIQYFIYPDGSKSDDTPNFLEILYSNKGAKGPTSVKLRWLVKTEKEVKIEIIYDFHKTEFLAYGQKYPGGEAGPGHYKCTIQLESGKKIISIDEEFDYEIAYSIKFSDGLNPDQARYRGWKSASVEGGFESPGKAYRAENERGYPMDATVNLPLTRGAWLTYWEPAGGEVNTGRYWLIYNSKASSNGNLLGIFQGDPSKIVGGRGFGVRISTASEKKNVKQVKESYELTIQLERRGPDNSWFKRKKFEWSVFISTKKDLLEPEKTQPIAVEMNYKSGLGSRIDSYADKPMILNPGFFEGSIFSSTEHVQKLMGKVKSDDQFYANLATWDSYSKPILDAWRTKDSAKSLIAGLIKFYEELKENYKSGEGIYRLDARYWVGANNFKFKAITISCLFADKSIAISGKEKEALTALVRMMARILWDDSNAPLNENAGVNFGPANMPFMYRNARYFFALLFSKDPEYSKRAEKVLNDVKKEISSAIYSNGATFGTPHYTQPTMEPILFTILQLRQAGVADLFKDSTRLLKFANFYLNLLTPPSPRFLGYRKLISFGDGSEESAPTFALLGSGYENVNKELSDQLYHAFENGAPKMSIFGPVFLAADVSGSHTTDFDFNSSNYFGYLSHLRSGANTSAETALWVLNGDSLFDHRNDDAGEIAIYALKAPLSVSRSSFYYPSASDSRIRSVVVPAAEFPEWSSHDQPIDKRSLQNRTWPKSTQTNYSKFPHFTSSISSMSKDKFNWTRKVVLLTIDKENPVVLMYDSVNNNADNIWSMLFMSEGDIQTPTGPISPEKRTHNNSSQKQLPNGTPPGNLKPGINKFSFSGQSWNKKYHPSGGIDWDLYTYTESNSSFSTAQWTTTWQNNPEQIEFRNTNGKPYEESQQILRWKSNDPFFSILLPYEKGNEYKNSVGELGRGLFLLKLGNDSMIFSKNGFRATKNEKLYAGTWGESEFHSNNISITGGPAEVEVTPKSVFVRVHGNSGNRMIILPMKNITMTGKNKAVAVRSLQDHTEIQITYTNKTLNLISTEKGYTEFVFVRGSQSR